MMIVWLVVGALIACVMFYSQWTDVRSLKIQSSLSFANKIRRRGLLRVFLVSVMLFAVFSLDLFHGLFSLLGFLITRSILLVVMNNCWFRFLED